MVVGAFARRQKWLRTNILLYALYDEAIRRIIVYLYLSEPCFKVSRNKKAALQRGFLLFSPVDSPDQDL
jgi:hypothetical protein